MQKHILLVLFALLSTIVHGQYRPSFFSVEVDSSILCTKNILNEFDTTEVQYIEELQNFFDSCGLISVDEALDLVGAHRSVQRISLTFDSKETTKQWNLFCYLKRRSPRRYGGFGTLVIYREILIDGITGKRISSKRVKELYRY